MPVMAKESTMSNPQAISIPSSKNILRLPQVIQKTGMSRATIYAYLKQSNFPAPISLGVRSVGWISSEVDQWIDSRIALRG